MNEGVYFKCITIENLKCFKKAITVNFTNSKLEIAPWTVIIGENGTGKTTLLKLIALSYPLDKMDNDSRLAPDIPKLTKADVLKTNSGVCNVLTVLRFGAFEVEKDQVKTKIAGTGAKMAVSGFDSKTNGQLPPISAYAAARQLGTGVINENGNNSYHSTDYLVFNLNTQINAEEWFLEAESLSTKSTNNETKAFHKNRYEKIRKVLIEILPDVSDIRIKEVTINDRKLSIELNTPYGWVEMHELSHGYKTLIGWTVDFASRMFEAYPESENPIKEPAVCIIDEIDLHLHPKWQRTVMQDLSQHFPKTQFIATAHSPLIVQSNPDAHIVLLKREGDHVVAIEDINEIKHWRIDQILTSDLFAIDSAWGRETAMLKTEKDQLLEKTVLSAAEEKRLLEINQILEKQGNSGSEVDSAIRFLQSLKS
ncbi:AAA family ATPase [bacterium]|nr:AAA family ATPase [bacterium]